MDAIYCQQSIQKLWQVVKDAHLGIYNIVQLDAELKIQGLQKRKSNSTKAIVFYSFTTRGYMLGRRKDLTVSLAIVNNFCDVARLKCRLTGFDKHLPSLNGIYQIYSIWKCKLAERKNKEEHSNKEEEEP